MGKNVLEEVFNEIYNNTNQSTLAFITAKCCNLNDVNDIFQETYTEIYSTINKKGPNYIENAEAFTRKIAKQKLYHYYSAKERLKIQISNIQTDINDEEVDLTDSIAMDYSLEDEFLGKEQISEVANFLKEKDLLTRKIFHLFYSLDKQIPEIAELLSINQSTVKNKIYRTINEIRKNFKVKEGARSE